MSFGRVIFGDNQFLGVNHSSQEVASRLHNKYSSTDRIIETLNNAYECGIRDFMFTTHHRYEEVFAEIVRSQLFNGMGFIPCVPYAHKYGTKISDLGVIGFAHGTMSEMGYMTVASALGRAIVGRPRYLIGLLLEVELLLSAGLNVRGVFLQNAAFDLAMATNQQWAVRGFAEYVESSLGVVPGFITMNHRRAETFLCDYVGVEEPWICSNYNPAGFRMNPTCEDVYDSFAASRSRNIAMSIFSSGRHVNVADIRQMAEKAESLGISSFLFGSSSKENIRENYDTFMTTRNGLGVL